MIVGGKRPRFTLLLLLLLSLLLLQLLGNTFVQAADDNSDVSETTRAHDTSASSPLRSVDNENEGENDADADETEEQVEELIEDLLGDDDGEGGGMEAVEELMGGMDGLDEFEDNSGGNMMDKMMNGENNNDNNESSNLDMLNGGDAEGAILMISALELFGKCNVDVMESAQQMQHLSSLALEDDPSAVLFRKLSETLTQLAGKACDEAESQEADFRQAMDTFQQCSEIDFMAFLETLPSAIFGTALQCILAYAPLFESASATTTTSSSSSSSSSTSSTLLQEEIPVECVEAWMGSNPLGDLVRRLTLFPERVLPCFATLATQVPACTLHQWPIPLLGPTLQQVACVIGNAQEVLKDLVYLPELNALNVCLPGTLGTDGTDHDWAGMDEAACNATITKCQEQNSILFQLSIPLRGMPLPDLAQTVAAEAVDDSNNALTSVVSRYHLFVNTSPCLQKNTWEGWNSVSYYKSGQVVGTMTTTNMNLGSLSSASTTKSNKPVDQVTSLESNSNSNHDEDIECKDENDLAMFGAGVGLGIFLVAALWCLVARRPRNILRSEAKGYNTVGRNEQDVDFSLT